MDAAVASPNCPNCGGPLQSSDLICASCGTIVHRAELEALSVQASILEQSNPVAAAAAWRRSLELLPPNSRQYQIIESRLKGLESQHAGARPHLDSLASALLKTGGSMALSIVIYYFYAGHSWAFAAGFVVLILIHEMGHVIANKFYGLHASPPIFIPFLGAVINLRQRPQNAKVEAVVGIGGPVAGTIGALACYAYAMISNNGMALFLAHLAFFLNLFNLLPVPPLDGGRVTAAVSPRIWILGLIAMGGLVADDLAHRRDVSVLVLILIFALPRLKETFRRRGQRDEYYNISRTASWTIGACYLLLLLVLAGCYYLTNRQLDMLVD